MVILPRTKLGTWSGYLYLAAIGTLVFGMLAALTSSATDFGPLIIWGMFFMIGCGLGIVGLLLSLVAMIKEKERAIVILLPWILIALYLLVYTLVPIGMQTGLLSEHYCVSEDGLSVTTDIIPYCGKGYHKVDTPPDWALD